MAFGWLWCVNVGVSIMAGMGERLGVGIGAWDWYVHTTIFKTDSQPRSTV